MEGEQFDTNETRPRNAFGVMRLEPRSTRWRQFALLGVGVIGLWVAHDIARRPRDQSTMPVLLSTGGATAVALAMVFAATAGFMNSVEHARTRVFRSRHLLVWGLTDVVVAVVLGGLLVIRGPFDTLLSHGKITGPDLADLGYLVAAGLCLVGAFNALLAALDSFDAERRWHHHL